MDDDHPIVLFDGVCNFCNGSVRFIARRDPRRVFRFASLQSPEGRRLVERHGRDPDDLSTMTLIDGDRCVLRSDAAIAIARRLRRPWPWLAALGRLVPRPLRDGAYSVVARNRYRWFGRTERCVVPDEALQDRFVAGEPSAIGHPPPGSG